MASGFVTAFLGISLQLRYYLAGLQVLLSLHPSASALEVLGSSPFTLEVLGSSPFTLEVLGSSPSTLEVLKSSHSKLEVLGSSPSTRVSASFDGIYSSLLYSSLLYSSLLYSTPVCSALLYTSLLYSNLVCSSLLWSTLLYSPGAQPFLMTSGSNTARAYPSCFSPSSAKRLSDMESSPGLVTYE